MRRNVIVTDIPEYDKYTIYKYLLDNYRHGGTVNYQTIRVDMEDKINGTSNRRLRDHLMVSNIATEGGLLSVHEGGWKEMERFIVRYEAEVSRQSEKDQLTSKQIRFYKYRLFWALVFLVLGGGITLLGKYTWLLLFPT